MGGCKIPYAFQPNILHLEDLNKKELLLQRAILITIFVRIHVTS